MRRLKILAGCFLTLALMFTVFYSLQAEEIRIHRGVVYHTVDGQELKADIYEPVSEPETLRPVVLLVHGGGWMGGNRTVPSMSAFGKLLAQSGIVAVSIDYRLVKDGPEGKILNQWPAAIEDCQAAVRWIRTQGEKYQLKTERIGACGESAGGHLVSLLGTTDRSTDGEPSSRVQAVINVYGPADLTRDFSHLKIGENFTIQTLVDRFLGAGNEQAQREASPQLHIDEQTADFLIYHGSADNIVPVEQSQNFAQKLKEAGRDVTYVEFAEDGHGFRGENVQKMVTQTLQFFKDRLQE